MLADDTIQCLLDVSQSLEKFGTSLRFHPEGYKTAAVWLSLICAAQVYPLLEAGRMCEELFQSDAVLEA
jgi:hypothetical protein